MKQIDGDSQTPSYTEVVAQLPVLRRENQRLRQRVAELEQNVLDLQDKYATVHLRLEEALGRGLRQAAPFRVPPKRKPACHRCGGQEGQPGQARAQTGSQGCVDERVEVPLDRCPQRGAALYGTKPVQQYAG